MSESAAPTTGKDLRNVLLGVFISLVALALVLYFADLDQVAAALSLADYRLLPLVVLIFLASIGSRAVAWRTLLQEGASYGRVFLTLNEGYLLNNLLPFRLGEFGRALLLGRNTSLGFWGVLSTILLERIFDVGIMAGLLLSTLPFVLGADWAQSAAMGAAALVLVGFTVLYLLARNRDWALRVFVGLIERVPLLRRFGRRRVEAFLEGLTALVQARRFLKVLFWMLMAWGANVGWYYLLLQAFLPGGKLLWAGFAVGVAGLGVSLPSSPAYVGVLEAALVGGLALFGVDPSVALAFAVIAHGVYLSVTVLLGAYGLAREGESLASLYQRVRHRPTETDPE